MGIRKKTSPFAAAWPVLLLPLVLTSWASAQSYTVTALGSLGGNGTTVPYAINSSGQVTGISTTATSGMRGFLYTSGVMRDLGTLGPANSYSCLGINDSGQVTGSAEINSSASHAFIYTNGTIQDIGTLAGVGDSSGYGINGAGQVTGSSNTSVGTVHAFLYANAAMQDLGTLGGDSSFGYAINGPGQVTGTADIFGNVNQAFLYSNGTMTGLGALVFLGRSVGEGINDVGQVSGWSNTIAGRHAFLYTSGSMHDLGTLGGGDSEGYGVNNAGEVVGYSEMAGNTIDHAFLYTGGSMQDLNSFIDPNSGWMLTSAQDINDAGQIIGLGTLNGVSNQPFLLTPTPEPETCAIGLIASLALLHQRRSSKDLPRV